jgi:hypothetical protein
MLEKSTEEVSAAAVSVLVVSVLVVVLEVLELLELPQAARDSAMANARTRDSTFFIFSFSNRFLWYLFECPQEMPAGTQIIRNGSTLFYQR